jgi:hypothetical protein
MLQNVSNERVFAVPIIRIIGHIFIGTYEEYKQLLNDTLLESLICALCSNIKKVRKECCWVISNIAAGGKIEAKFLFDCSIMMRMLLKIFEEDE